MSVEFYNQHAQSFFANTAFVDMTELHDRFCRFLPTKAKILDLGCGSGRDTKAFIQRGYEVIGYDASIEIVKLAREYTGAKIIYGFFKDIDFVGEFDAIWACASLLHVPGDELDNILEKLMLSLKPNGLIYLSFKEGESQREKDGRTFTDMTLESLRKLLINNKFTVIDQWLTDDVRQNRNETWVNALAKKSL